MLRMPVVYRTKPLSIQLELTYACNNKCAFCYNRLDGANKRNNVPYDRLKTILEDLREFGVFTINFNGGEPLLYDNFFDLAKFCSELGFDIHLNTNATLINEENAEMISRLFPAICTSLHGEDSAKHDNTVGRANAFAETVEAIKLLIKNDVYVAVNVTVTKQNLFDIDKMAEWLASLGVGTLLVSRVLTDDKCVAVSDEEFLTVLESVLKFQRNATRPFARIGLPQPFPLCRIGNHAGLFEFISASNVPCSAGIATARITPNGSITPCPVLPYPEIGNINNELFSTAWDRFNKEKWVKTETQHENCDQCMFLKSCGGGCLPCDSSGCLLNNRKGV